MINFYSHFFRTIFICMSSIWRAYFSFEAEAFFFLEGDFPVCKFWRVYLTLRPCRRPRSPWRPRSPISVRNASWPPHLLLGRTESLCINKIIWDVLFLKQVRNDLSIQKNGSLTSNKNTSLFGLEPKKRGTTKCKKMNRFSGISISPSLVAQMRRLSLFSFGRTETVKVRTASCVSPLFFLVFFLRTRGILRTTLSALTIWSRKHAQKNRLYEKNRCAPLCDPDIIFIYVR